MRKHLLYTIIYYPLVLVAVVALLISCSSDNDSNPTTQNQAIAAAGGADSLSTLNAFSVSATGESWIFDEGFIPGGPADPAGTYSLEMTYDVAGNNIRLDYVRQSVGLTRTVSEVVVGQVGFIDGNDINFNPASTRPMTSDRWASTVQMQRLLNPQLILLEILQNPGLVIGSSANQLIVDDDVNPMTLDLDPTTGLIDRHSTLELDNFRRDVELVVDYDNWQQFGGIFFPMAITIALDGEVYHQETRSTVSINPALTTGLFDIPAGITPVFDAALADRGKRTSQYLQSFATIGFIKDGAHEVVDFVEIVPGVFHLPDPSNNSMVVEQANGIVVVEGVLHDLRAEAILNWVAGRFPTKPVTHVINTHHHTDHGAGLRPYVADGASVVVHEFAQDFYTDMLARTDTTILPDALDLNPLPANIQTFSRTGSFTISDAQLPVAVFPVTSTHSVDLAIASAQVPGSAVIFVSDIFSPGAPAGPGAVEFNNAVIAAGIDTTGAIVAGGHGGTIPYSQFLTLLP